MRALTFLIVLVAAAASAAARAEPLPEAGPLALDVFFDGCLNAVLDRKDPGPAIERALAPYRHETARTPDPAHPEHRLWHVRGFDGDIEFETFDGKSWCEARLIGADPESAARRLNNALAHLDVPMQSRSLPGGAPGVSVEAVTIGHDASDAMVVFMREDSSPKDGEPGLTLSAAPLRPAGQGHEPSH